MLAGFPVTLRLSVPLLSPLPSLPLRPGAQHELLWVTDFPMFEYDEVEKR